jgi:N-acyl-L-homoserine lactone synthetase
MTGTERKKWQYVAMQNLMDWARQNGCYKAICYSRKGWAKVFKAHGFKDTHLALEINLTNKEDK